MAVHFTTASSKDCELGAVISDCVARRNVIGFVYIAVPVAFIT
ncbi:hypothetical protein N8612_01300 [Verrucomicrobia bacterium]|nr:hypothetical protein [Verrucomicrobiota bacterium]